MMLVSRLSVYHSKRMEATRQHLAQFIRISSIAGHLLLGQECREGLAGFAQAVYGNETLLVIIRGSALLLDERPAVVEDFYNEDLIAWGDSDFIV
jgi:hypothetical protein